jgi:hypothetical protein
MDQNALDKFFSKVEKTDGCWFWKGGRQSRIYSYGIFSLDGENVYAHRLSWIIHYGKIENNLCVLHKCDIPLCVNPDHLFLGSQIDNLEDCRKKGRSRNGSMPGEKHPLSVLSNQKVLEIRSLHGLVLQKDIALKYGVKKSQINKILLHKAWVQI